MTEAQHQQMIIKWSQQPTIRHMYPELKLLYHVPNERKCSAIQGRLLKLMGVKSGVPDLVLPVARGGYHGLYLELKADKGKLSDSQKWWLLELTRQGYYAVCCHGWEEAVECLKVYLRQKS